MKLTLSLDLSDEHMDALKATVDELNARRPEGSPLLTPKTFLEDQNRVYVEGRATHYYATALGRFGDGFKAADYATRKAIMADLESKLPQ